MAELFRCYVRLWTLTEAALHVHDAFLIPHAGWAYAQAVLFAAAFLRPTPLVSCAAVLARVAMYAVQAPFIWDSCVWSLFTDLTFVASTLVFREDGAVRACADLIRIQMGLFYIGAGFWKINSAFLDPHVSCAPIYVASLISYVPEALTPHWTSVMLRLAPVATIIGECGLGICLLMPGRRARRVGALLAALLHYAIALTPHPNQVSGFGVFCVTRFFFVLPAPFATAISETMALPSSVRAWAARVVSTALVVTSIRATSMPGVFIDWCLPVQTALCLLLCRACWLPDEQPKVNLAAAPPPPRRRALLGAARVIALTLTVLYVFVFQQLGLMDISATSPFSSIREHGGSNHFLLPTSLLFQWSYTTSLEPFSGGVVRVTRSTSDYMNALYPANCSDELSPRVVALLRAAGHSALEFNPTVRQMIGADLRAHEPYWRPSSRKPFPSYTIPAVQLRRMLAEVRDRGEGFELEYEVLPGVVGDETWRKTAVERSVRLVEDGRGGRRCRSRMSRGWVWSACAGDEIALLPPPRGPLMKMMLFFPYPIVPDLDELPCMD